MDDGTEDNVEYTFTVFEVDLDYEFDAARCFDFSREETFVEACEAELWFESSGSYPPSPFVSKLSQGDDAQLENVNVSPKPKDVQNMLLLDNSDSDMELERMDVSHRDCGDVNKSIFDDSKGGYPCLQKDQSQAVGVQQLCKGLMGFKDNSRDNLKLRTKSSVKPSFPRSSTLMKPTASQLAKQQYQSCKVSDSRSHKVVENNAKGPHGCGIEIQAAKRQKLEGGLLHKVTDMNQHTNLIHKEPKRNLTQKTSTSAPQRLTVPREPGLETTQRAGRMRPKSNHKFDRTASTTRKFKALPLNRKILEAPSFLPPKRTMPRLPEFQEFHLKTSERAMHHTFAVSSSSVNRYNTEAPIKHNASSGVECQNRVPTGATFMDTTKEDGEVHSFKALPLNKKIFSSKGDMGVFRNIKKDVTIPMEFNFQKRKMIQHELPIELFNKLSLTSEAKLNTGSTVQLPPRTCMPSKGSKENRFGSCQQEGELVKEKRSMIGARQNQCGSGGTAPGIGPLSDMSSNCNRRLGIR